MTDFTKLKMGFSVGLLAVLFTLRPLFENVGAYPVRFPGFQVTLLQLYYAFMATLGLASYFFALELISGKAAVPFAQKAGNTLYALAVLMPPAFVAAVLVSQAGQYVLGRGGLAAAKAVYAGLGLVLLAALLLVMWRLRAMIGERDRSFSVRHLGDEETEQLAKAQGLLDAGLYDLSVVQAFQTVETSLRRLLLARGRYERRRSVKEMMEAAEGAGLLGSADSRRVQDVRVLRNEVVHEGKPVVRDTAEEVVDNARKVVTRIGMLLSDAGGEAEEDASGTGAASPGASGE
jgi:HEPN domain-containing protein